MDRRRFIQILSAGAAALALGQIPVDASPVTSSWRTAGAWLDVPARAWEDDPLQLLELAQAHLGAATRALLARDDLVGLETTGLRIAADTRSHAHRDAVRLWARWEVRARG